MKSFAMCAAKGLIFVLVIRGWAAEISLLPVNSFGRPLAGCVVVSFKTIDDETRPRREYWNQFSGLVARAIPMGEYAASIQCGKVEFGKRIMVGSLNQFEIIASRQDILAFDHGKPSVTIKMDEQLPDHQTWWVRLMGVYNGESYAARFDQGTAEARLPRPFSGRYFVVMLSTGGYSCSREVDVASFSKLWSFHRSDCSFHFDEFARFVEERDRDPLMPGRIEESIQRQWDEIQRSLPKQ